MNRLPKITYDIFRLSQYPTTKTLMDSLAELLGDMDTVYLIVDAVDESHPRDELLFLLEALVTDPRLCKIRLLATSRRYHDIESALTRLSSPISMLNEEIDKDIRAFVASQLERKFIGWRAAHKSNVSDALVQKANGMYVLNTSLAAHINKAWIWPDVANSDQVVAKPPDNISQVRNILFKI